jgi:Fe-S cluster assembly protein SufD
MNRPEVSLEKKVREISSSLGEPGWMLSKRLSAASALHKLGEARKEEARIKLEAAKRGELADRMAANLEISAGPSEGKDPPAKKAADGGKPSKSGEYLVADFDASSGSLEFRAKTEGVAAVMSISEAMQSSPEFESMMKLPLSGKEPESYLLSLALFTSGNVAIVPAGAKAGISLEMSGSPPAYFATFFLFAASSSVSVSAKTAFASDSHECRGIFLSAGCEAQCCFSQHNSEKALGSVGMVARAGEGSRLKFLNSNMGGAEKRDGFLFLQDGRGSRCEHYEVSLAKGKQRFYKDSEHLHAAPDTFSRSIFKYATAGSSLVDVNGLVTIEKGAPGSDTHLLAKSLLLSEKSVSKVVPMLFVHNSEVAAGHGSAMTPLQDEELFYLRSRGIGENESRLLVLQGFMQDLLLKSEMGGQALGSLAAELDKEALAIFPRD